MINFHACVDSGYLTILAGYSGTGKSALAKAYVKYMTRDDSLRYVLIPITPLFTEPSILYGFYSSTMNAYKPDKNGFINLIREANEDINKINTYYVIFDEINLAPVENWFCEFISKMESGDDLVLYDDTEKIKSVIDEFIEQESMYLTENMKIKLEQISDQFTQAYKSRYSLKNIKFIGTMNEDESGNSVSGRVLDRSSKITLQRPDLDEIVNASREFNNPSKYQQRFIDIAKELNRKTLEIIKELEKEGKDYSDIGRTFISPRVVMASLKYIASVESIDGIQGEIDEMIDLLFCQKVFSKLSANDNTTLVKRWLEVCNSSLYNLKTSATLLSKIISTLEF